MASCLWTDPPYNVNYIGTATKTREVIRNDKHASAESFRTFLLAAFRCAHDHLAPGSGCYIAHADMEAVNFRTALIDAGFYFAQCLVWIKSHFVLGRQDHQYMHEPILYGRKEGEAHRWYGGRDKTTVFVEKKPAASELHPTTKPVRLIERMLANSTLRGEIVLDLFGGSGSTLIACEQLGRAARLMELDPAFVDVIVRRWQDLTGQRATREADGAPFEAPHD